MNTEDAKPWILAVQDLLNDWLAQYTLAETHNAATPIAVDVVASPDVDGILSIALLQRWLQQTTNGACAIRIAAIYTTTDIIMLGATTRCDLKRALWVDHDVLGNCRSIGNHLTQMRPHDRLPHKHEKSFNPNSHAGVAFSNAFRGVGAVGRDKYPFGTAHLLAHALFADELNVFTEKQPHHSLFAWLAHADGAWLTAQMYQQSALLWYQDEFESAPWMQFLFHNYLHDSLRFAKHSALAKSLGLALQSNLQRASSASLQSDRFLYGAQAMQWSACRGHQGLTNCTGWNVAQINDNWLPAFREMLTLVQVSFGTAEQNKIMAVEEAQHVHCGTVHKPNPSDLLESNVSMPTLLKENGAFSVAFVSRRMVRYTVDLDI
jgi:hypothetical protein